MLDKMFTNIVEGEIFLPDSPKIDFPLYTNELFTQLLLIVSPKHNQEETKDSKDDETTVSFETIFLNFKFFSH